MALSSNGSLGQDNTYLQKPDDEGEIEEAFMTLMQKRGWHNLPEQARRQMMAYPAAKKWTLVHQDRLTEIQGAEKRRVTRQPGQYGRECRGRRDAGMVREKGHG
jgi:cytokinesis protein